MSSVLLELNLTLEGVVRYSLTMVTIGQEEFSSLTEQERLTFFLFLVLLLGKDFQRSGLRQMG